MFQRPVSGYTIIETLIFLAISGTMLATALFLVQGWQSKVQFDQSMRDLNSKVEQYVQDVSSGFFQGSNTYKCTANGGSDGLRPALSGGGGKIGTNQECIFLGKAIGALPDTNQLTVYTVLGDRVYPAGTAFAGQSIASFDQAYPEPMIPQLNETYDLLWGAKIHTSKVTYIDPNTNNPVTISTPLVGFYNDLQNTTAAGAPYVLTKAYGTADLGSVKSCIEQVGACANYRFTEWDLCLSSGSSNKNALLIVTPSGLGVSTKLNIGGC